MKTLRSILYPLLKTIEYFLTFIGLIFRLLSEGLYYIVGLIRKW